MGPKSETVMDMQPIVHALARRALVYRRCLVPSPDCFACAAEITGQDRHGVRASVGGNAVRELDEGWETARALMKPWKTKQVFLFMFLSGANSGHAQVLGRPGYTSLENNTLIEVAGGKAAVAA